MKKKQNTESMDKKQLMRYAEDISSMYKVLKKENKLLQKANRELQESFISTSMMGFDLINHFDSFLGGHCRRVAYYADQLCKALKLDIDENMNIRLAALIHDIGLIGIPRSTLKNMYDGKGSSKLEVYQKHPIVNIRPFTSNNRFKSILEIIRCHHENIDGSGFPNGVVGDKIPLGSKIIAIVSNYDEVRLLKRKALDPKKIINKFEKDVGTKYDPEIFQTFKEFILKGDPLKNTEFISFAELNAGMVIATSIKTVQGEVLLKAETELNEDHLQILRRFYDYDKLVTPIKVYKQKG